VIHAGWAADEYGSKRIGLEADDPNEPSANVLNGLVTVPSERYLADVAIPGSIGPLACGSQGGFS